jgi:hypothetical protein
VRNCAPWFDAAHRPGMTAEAVSLLPPREKVSTAGRIWPLRALFAPLTALTMGLRATGTKNGIRA